MINQEAHKRLLKARSKLMQGHIGMASMLLNLELVEVASSQCSTMATDGKRIMYSPDFVLDLEEPELQAVLVHESLHVVWEHVLRRQHRHFKVWNIACDYAINGFLKYDLRMELPEGGLWSQDHRGKSAETIYRELINSEEALQDAIDTINDGESTEGSSGEGSGEGDNSKLSAPNCNTGQAVGDINLDSLPLAAGEVWDAQDSDGKPLSESEITELRSQIQRSVSLADKLEKSMSRSGTSGIGARIDSLKEPQVDWKGQLRDFLESSVSHDNSWSRLNKRHQWRGVYLPSKAKSPMGGELAVAMDTSSSVDQDEVNVFASEIQAMAEECGLDKIRVCYCDTTVRKNEDGEWWDVYELNQGDELKLKVRGRGGTEFDPPFNLFNDYSEDVEDVLAFIYFTDGYGIVNPDVEPDVPVIWCVTQESHYSKDLPFGEVLYVNPDTLY